MQTQPQFAHPPSDFISRHVLALPPDALIAAYCDPDRQRIKAHEPFGLALFYHVAQRDPFAAESWDYLFQHFDRIVGGWVSRIVRGLSIHEIRDLSHEALARFWEHFGLPQFAKSEGHLSRVIGLLRTIAQNHARDVLRNQTRHATCALPIHDDTHISLLHVDADGATHEQLLALPQERTPEFDVLSAMTADALWDCIADVCKTAREQIVAELSWDQDLAPREICAMHPKHFISAEEISDILRVLQRRLRKHPRVLAIKATR